MVKGSGRWFRYTGGLDIWDMPRWWLTEMRGDQPFEAPDMTDGDLSCADDLAGHAQFEEVPAPAQPEGSEN
jgi:hypothetical protein